MKKVIIVMGSDSDLPVMEPAMKTLADFGVPHEVRVISAHRTPEEAHRLSANARADGVGVIIAAAGKAAHLAGVLAASTTLPVIGVPIKSSAFGGLDSLLSTVQMPAGVPVATVAVDGAQNAALLAVQMLAICDGQLAEALSEHKLAMADSVAAKDAKVRASYGK
ncbi:MAG: 5-(carboxyamino)imidazole ribonucleotide mutase [Clostridia bacterium]|nr:5-(carboxyamino)imidazole ribonucleotide mutase [Clostridia bacterium]